MWNEYMEWEDDRDPITFYDEDEYCRNDPLPPTLNDYFTTLSGI